MPGRFQFNLKRLLGSVSLFAVAAWLFTVGGDDPRNAASLLAAVALGSAVGELFGRPFFGALVVIGFGAITLCLMLSMTNELGIFIVISALGCGMVLLYFIIEDRERQRRISRRHEAQSLAAKNRQRETCSGQQTNMPR